VKQPRRKFKEPGRRRNPEKEKEKEKEKEEEGGGSGVVIGGRFDSRNQLARA